MLIEAVVNEQQAMVYEQRSYLKRGGIIIPKSKVKSQNSKRYLSWLQFSLLTFWIFLPVRQAGIFYLV